MSALQLKRTRLFPFVFSALLLAVPAYASNVNVDCSGSSPAAFHSINDALNTLDLIGPNAITVRGTCRENVIVAARDRLTIQATAGHFATIQNAATQPTSTLWIIGSHNIVLDHLIIDGGSPALYVSQASSTVVMQNCTLQNSVADGLDMDGESQLLIQDSTIRKNSAAGIFISNESQLVFGTYPSQRIRITGNGFGGNGNGAGGLEIDGSQVQLNFGVLTIDGNAGPGISMDGGRLQFYGGQADSPGVIENNNTGLILNDAASATLWGAFHVRNNGSTGISVNGASSITFSGGTDSQGHNVATTIREHSTVGLALSQSSSAQIYGPHIISKNGSADADPNARGGISLEGASLTIGGGTSVDNNVGPGIRLLVKSDLIMYDMRVSDNTEEGVLETNLSGGGFYDPLVFNGNGGAPLRCDKFSVAFGDADKIHNADCKNITKGGGRRPNVRIPYAR
ncbi:MAG TPA: right-handed parallel beta-helix repeat-containing protein [Terriglobales bacterium]|nr:right-handed parallel beta-helix repeat-containing protein [Terriglobales bacterium]